MRYCHSSTAEDRNGHVAPAPFLFAHTACSACLFAPPAPGSAAAVVYVARHARTEPLDAETDPIGDVVLDRVHDGPAVLVEVDLPHAHERSPRLDVQQRPQLRRSPCRGRALPRRGARRSPAGCRARSRATGPPLPGARSRSSLATRCSGSESMENTTGRSSARRTRSIRQTGSPRTTPSRATSSASALMLTTLPSLEPGAVAGREDHARDAEVAVQLFLDGAFASRTSPARGGGGSCPAPRAAAGTRGGSGRETASCSASSASDGSRAPGR